MASSSMASPSPRYLLHQRPTLVVRTEGDEELVPNRHMPRCCIHLADATRSDRIDGQQRWDLQMQGVAVLRALFDDGQQAHAAGEPTVSLDAVTWNRR